MGLLTGLMWMSLGVEVLPAFKGLAGPHCLLFSSISLLEIGRKDDGVSSEMIGLNTDRSLEVPSKHVRIHFHVLPGFV